MKAKVRIPLIVVASVLAAIIVAVIVLCFVNVRPIKDFNNYAFAKIETNDTTTQISDIMADTPDTKQLLDKGLDKSGFSVMHAWLEFQYSFKPKFEKKDDPDSTEKKPPQINNELTWAEVQSRTKAGESNYVLELQFQNPKTMKVEKTDVQYDRVRMNVAATGNQIEKVYVYIYLHDKTYGEGNPEVDDYRIVPLIIKLNTTALYDAIGEIKTLGK